MLFYKPNEGSKMKIDIKNIITGAVIYSHEQENNNIGITLEKAVKERANLHYADLRKQKLVGLDFVSARFIGADLSYSDLTGSNLQHANLYHANLTGANLAYVNLNSTDLIGANFTGAKLTGAIYKDATLEKGLLQLYGKQWPILIFDDHIKIGCELHKTSEWENFTDDEIAAMDAKALSFWKENKQIILNLAKHHQGTNDA